MNKNVKIAKELLKLANNLIVASDQKTKRIQALASFLGVNENEISLQNQMGTLFLYKDQNYFVLTKKQREEYAYDDLKQSLEEVGFTYVKGYKRFINEDCFKGKSIEQMLDLYTDKELVKKYPDCFNEDACIKYIIDHDGYGYVISSYDGEENVSNGYYIYRIN